MSDNDLDHLIEAGARNAAEALGRLDESGTVNEGKRADLILVEGDPVQDAANVAQQAGIMLRGCWLPKAKAQTMLAELVHPELCRAPLARELYHPGSYDGPPATIRSMGKPTISKKGKSVTKKQFAHLYFVKEEPERIRALVPLHVEYWQECNPGGYQGPFC